MLGCSVVANICDQGSLIRMDFFHGKALGEAAQGGDGFPREHLDVHSVLWAGIGHRLDSVLEGFPPSVIPGFCVFRDALHLCDSEQGRGSWTGHPGWHSPGVGERRRWERRECGEEAAIPPWIGGIESLISHKPRHQKPNRGG